MEIYSIDPERGEIVCHISEPGMYYRDETLIELARKYPGRRFLLAPMGLSARKVCPVCNKVFAAYDENRKCKCQEA